MLVCVAREGHGIAMGAKAATTREDERSTVARRCLVSCISENPFKR